MNRGFNLALKDETIMKIEVNLQAIDSSSDLLELKSLLVNFLSENNTTNWHGENPVLSFELLKLLTAKQVKILLNLNLIYLLDNNFYWNFIPVYGHGLLLFRDLHSRRYNSDFAWLRSKTTSTSWEFADFLNLGKAERVLDLGTGVGLNALRLASKASYVYGVDLNPRAISLAVLNSKLNCISNCKFTYSDWKSYKWPKVEHIISQPPFDPKITTETIMAFTGGENFGQAATFDIVEKFKQSDAKYLHIYTHSFEKNDHLLIDSELNKIIPQKKYEIKTLKKYNLEDWWEKFKIRYGIPVESRIPENLKDFSGVRGVYFRGVRR